MLVPPTTLSVDHSEFLRLSGYIHEIRSSILNRTQPPIIVQLDEVRTYQVYVIGAIVLNTPMIEVRTYESAANLPND